MANIITYKQGKVGIYQQLFTTNSTEHSLEYYCFCQIKSYDRYEEVKSS